MPTLDLPPLVTDFVDQLKAADWHKMRAAIAAVNSALDSLITTVSGKANASHQHAASDLTSGTVATARLGSGTASSSTFLRGDQTYAAITTSGAVSDASTTANGILRLAGDLSGTATSPTVPGLAAKAPIASPTFTGTVAGISKSMVGLGSVDNTADTAKPVSTAQASALAGKSDTGHTHAATDLASGLVPTARLGTGTASSSTFLRGDQTYAAITTSGTVADASTTAKGIVQLTGDLAGTATAPTVPGLATKAALSHTHAISDVSDLQTQLNQKAPLARGLPAGGAAGQALVKTSSTDYAAGYATVEVANIAVSGTYPTRPSATLVCWIGPDPGSLAQANDSWREA